MMYYNPFCASADPDYPKPPRVHPTTVNMAPLGGGFEILLVSFIMLNKRLFKNFKCLLR